jgi:hypothetical protein
MDMESDKILFPEAVFAAIEVKSKLTSEELADMAKKSASLWSLNKTLLPNIILSPALIIPAVNIPILCLGICFESDLSLADIATKLRIVRQNIELAYSLSIVCVLEDNKKRSGLIVNNSFDNLQNITLIPDPQSRLSIIDCETAGDALLYMYLLIMEHLRNCGTSIPAPNLMAYAAIAGLGVTERRVSASEMAGAYVDLSGTIISTDIALRVSELTPKVLKEIASAEEIFEWFSLIPLLPSGEVVLNPRAVFSENGKPLSVPRPRIVYDAIIRKKEGKSNSGDVALLETFVNFIHSIHLQNRSFGIEEL